MNESINFTSHCNDVERGLKNRVRYGMVVVNCILDLDEDRRERVFTGRVLVGQRLYTSWKE